MTFRPTITQWRRHVCLAVWQPTGQLVAARHPAGDSPPASHAAVCWELSGEMKTVARQLDGEETAAWQLSSGSSVVRRRQLRELGGEETAVWQLSSGSSVVRRRRSSSSALAARWWGDGGLAAQLWQLGGEETAAWQLSSGSSVVRRRQPGSSALAARWWGDGSLQAGTSAIWERTVTELHKTRTASCVCEQAASRGQLSNIYRWCDEPGRTAGPRTDGRAEDGRPGWGRTTGPRTAGPRTEDGTRMDGWAEDGRPGRGRKDWSRTAGRDEDSRAEDGRPGRGRKAGRPDWGRPGLGRTS